MKMMIDRMVFQISDETRDVDGCQQSPFFLRPTGSQIRGANSMGVPGSGSGVRYLVSGKPPYPSPIGERYLPP